MSNKTACPLDCYDACEIEYTNNKLLANSSGHTAGFLCPHLNHYSEYKTILLPRYKGVDISMDKALSILKEMIISSKKSEILHYRGHGNFSLMQEVTDHFFASYGATLTNGSLCDGAGESGILAGRGSNKNMSIDEISKSDVIMFWGRNPHTTSSHLLPIIKDKKIIVVDPVRTKIAKNADIYLQIKPHKDKLLALIFSHILYLNNEHDKLFLENNTSNYRDFLSLINTMNIEDTLKEIDVSKKDIESVLELLKGKRVAFVCGVGIQKYLDGSDVMRSIDSFAAMLGLFGKDGCGVAYLGASRDKIVSPFYTKSKKISMVNTDFSDFKTVFIQGANPLSQMPDSNRVIKSIKKSENIVYYGLYENETSEIADLVIPAKSFLCKDDIRTSYSHNVMSYMNKQLDSDYGISEYDLSYYLCQEFGVDIDDESSYIKHFKSFSFKEENGFLHVSGREKVGYRFGFDTQDKKFIFLEDANEKYNENSGSFFLITSKSEKSLNSQFKRENSVYLNSRLGYSDGEIIKISSINGSIELKVKNCDDVREDSVLIYSGTRGVNNLTTSTHSRDGMCAIYQENLVNIESK